MYGVLSQDEQKRTAINKLTLKLSHCFTGTDQWHSQGSHRPNPLEKKLYKGVRINIHAQRNKKFYHSLDWIVAQYQK